MAASSAQAWDGIKSGKITGIDVTDGQNFGFRIYMDGSPMCGTAEVWAYMNRDFDNYDAMAALLTSAYLSGRSVAVQPKRGRLWLNDGSCIRLRPEYPGHVWAYDFVEKRTHDGRKFRILTIIDEASRASLRSAGADRVTPAAP